MVWCDCINLMRSSTALWFVEDWFLVSVSVPDTLTEASFVVAESAMLDGPTAPLKGKQAGLVRGLSATTVEKRSDFNLGANLLGLC